MSINGLDMAITFAIERAKRSKQAICIVQIDKDAYVLWREVNIEALKLVYKHYKIVKVIRIRNDDFR
jgi:hypothetical protein